MKFELVFKTTGGALVAAAVDTRVERKRVFVPSAKIESNNACLPRWKVVVIAAIVGAFVFIFGVVFMYALKPI
jgi:hypothetical protein